MKYETKLFNDRNTFSDNLGIWTFLKNAYCEKQNLWKREINLSKCGQHCLNIRSKLMIYNYATQYCNCCKDPPGKLTDNEAVSMYRFEEIK